MKKIFFGIGLIVLIAAVSIVALKKDEWKAGGVTALEQTYLRSAISNEDILKYARLEVLGRESAVVENEDGKQYLSLRVYPGQMFKNKGVRAELAIDFPYKEGDTVLYSWQVRIPENFESDAPQNRWWLMGQWHDQPDPSKGETWADYPSHSPPLAIGYAVMDGKDVFGFVNKPDQKDYVTMPITRGTWHTIALEVTWSQKDDGKVKLFFDDMTHPVADETGKNMLNAYQHYFKVGQYRHKDITADSTIHIRNITIKKLK